MRINKLYKKKSEILADIANNIIDENRDKLAKSFLKSLGIDNASYYMPVSSLCLYRSYIFAELYNTHIAKCYWTGGSYFVDCEKNNNLVGCGPELKGELGTVQGGGSLIYHFFCWNKIGNKTVIIDPSAPYFPKAAKEEIQPPAKWLIPEPKKAIYEFEKKLYPTYEYKFHKAGTTIGKEIIAKLDDVIEQLILEIENEYLDKIG